MAKDAEEKEKNTINSYVEIIDEKKKVLASRNEVWDGATMLTITISNITGGTFTINVNNVEANNYGKLYYYVNNTLVYSGTDTSVQVTEIKGEPIKDHQTYEVKVLAEPFTIKVNTTEGDNVDSWLACIGNSNQQNYTLDNLDELFANETLMLDLLQSDTAWDYLLASTEKILPKFYTNNNAMSIICKNENSLKKACEDERMFKILVESQEFRTAMYDNAQITESIIAKSANALKIMKASSRYASSKTAALNSSSKTATLYADKSFVFTCAAYSNNDYSIYLIPGNFIVGNATLTGRGSSGKTLTMTVNKFASTVTGRRYNGWDAQPITMTYFKI